MKKTLLIFLVLISTGYISAQVRLPKLISNGMVLQRDQPLKIWGWAAPGEEVRILFLNQSFQSKADKEGNWKILLPAQKAGGPYQMNIKGSNEIVLTDIVFGDVWLCSGQSNMELMMQRLKYKYPEEIANADNNFIRQFTVPDKYDFNGPRNDLDAGNWLSLNSKSILEFSGVAYFFAKELNARYKVPIGIINSALGGSPAEAWISEESLKNFPDYYHEAQQFKNKNLISEIEAKDREVSNSWYKKLIETDEGIMQKWTSPSLDDADWKSMKIPGYWADTNAGNFNGSVWFRKDIEVPASMTGKPIKLELGRIIDADSVFINGQFAGTTGYQYPPRRYELPATILKEGRNNIVVRIVSNSGRGGFVPDKPYRLTTNKDTIDLKGEWKFKTGAMMSALPGQTIVRWKPTGLYNAMIAPLINYAIKGAAWYQGESNASRPGDYSVLMETLIGDWRKKWQEGNFPFIYVQLPNFMEKKSVPLESAWAALRQEQLNNLSVPNTAMVVAIDAGEWNDIHPENKKDIGKRLALQAQRIAYGDDKIVSSGPLYQRMKIIGNKIVISFTNTGSGLMAKSGDLKYFAIAGIDKKYVWANAMIKNNTVIVWNDAVQNPVSVRYAWADNPEGANLYNKDGLPASPFSTDK